MKKPLLLLLLALCTVPQTLNASDYAAPFLDKGVQARASGFGNGYSALATGSDAVYWNPAGLGQLNQKWDSAIMGFQAFETTYMAAQGALPVQTPLGKITLGAAYISSRLDGIQTTTLDNSISRYTVNGETSYAGSGYFIGVGMPVADNIYAGTALKVVQETAGAYKATGVGADIGIKYLASKTLTFSGTIQNLIQPNMNWNTPSSNTDTIARVFKIGVGYELSPNLIISTDGVYRKNQLFIQGGVEYALNPQFVVRAGGNTDEFSIGTGLELSKDIYLDFAWTRPSQWEVPDSYKLSLKIIGL